MKLLLTSEGFYNQSIKQAFCEMLPKPIEETKIILVTTAANARPSDKRWLISLMNQLVSMKFKSIDVMDFAGLSKEQWLPRLNNSDVIFFSGGDSVHLMSKIRKEGLEEELQTLLLGRIFVGNSAGSIVATKNLSLSNPVHKEQYQKLFGEVDNAALGLVDFLVRPHFNSPGHPSTEENVLDMMKQYSVKEDVYLIDDNTALRVVDSDVDVVSEGEWKLLRLG